MKKLNIIFLALIIISCSSADSISDNVPTNNTDEVTTTVVNNDKESNDTTTTTTSIADVYIFNEEKMSPFTGLELPPELWLKRPRRVLAFKVDNNLNARPQSGLEDADSVYEILVEGGMTRFLAFFYDKTSVYVGPIRSARPTDPTLVRPYGGILVVSGATPGLVPQIRELGVAVLEEQQAPAMFRITSRNAPHNLYGDTELIRKIIDEKGYPFNPPPGPIYSFGYNQDNWKSGANRVTITYSDFTKIIWKLDGTKYSRFIIDGYAPSPEAMAHNIINRDGDTQILQTETIAVIQGAIYIDEATTLPSVLTVGVGPVFLFNNGNYIEGTWRRNDISEPFEFYDEEQNPIFVPPSKQWVHVLPLNSGEIVWSSS
tara:strand:+ start:2368 stop:3486 length:1119 start_codon:yes stop_codon:yes gene_type:complete